MGDTKTAPFPDASQALDAYTRRRYRVLFATLLLTLAVSPLRSALSLQSGLLELLVEANLIVAAAGISIRRGPRYALLGASLLAVALRALPDSASLPWLVVAGGVLWVVIGVTAAAAAMRFALRAVRVDAEHVAAALSAYLLAGLLFGVLYALVDHRWPGSLIDVSGPGGPLTLETAIYYSFVTLATLGYGDIVPRGAARGLAVVEAIGAQLYLTVTVARLVGVYTLGAQQQAPPEGTGTS